MIIRMGYSTRFLYWRWWVVLAVILIDIASPFVPIISIWLLLGLFINPIWRLFERFIHWEG